MIIKRSLIALSVLAPLAFGSIAYAVTTVPSDFAQDFKDGTAQLSNDKTAQSQANNVKDDENVEGQVDDGQVQVDETVGDQEANMDTAQSGESHDTHDKIDASTSNDSGSTTSPTDNGSHN